MRFADRVARSPRQVVRYAYGGQPLWSASDPPKVDVPLCACGESAAPWSVNIGLLLAPTCVGKPYSVFCFLRGVKKKGGTYLYLRRHKRP